MTYNSESINELATALAKAQSEIRNAQEDKNNPHFKSKYATLASLWEACREPLSKNGLSISQIPQMEDSKFVLVTMLMHSSGQWIRSSFPIQQSMKIQETGSQITYIRRYTLSSLVGVAPGEQLDDDDDGERAHGRQKSKEIEEVKKIEEPKEVYISKEEADELLKLVSNCSEDFQMNFHKNKIDVYKMRPPLHKGTKRMALENINQLKRENEQAIKSGDFKDQASEESIF